MSKVSFKTNIHLKDVLGQELINDDNIAICELVKNSYDSTSDSVLVRFLDITDATESSLLVLDQGSGMDRSDIVDKWLNIAYSVKRNSEDDGYSFAGNKGIGRFSCDRLGKKLTLVTRKGVRGEILKLEIDWLRFEEEDDGKIEINSIKLNLDTIDLTKAREIIGSDKFLSGTALVIKELRSNWDHESLLKLRKTLSKVINPNLNYVRNKFRIRMEVPELKDKDSKNEPTRRINGEIRNEIFKDLEFRTSYIKCFISKNGSEIHTELYDNGSLLFKIKEENIFKSLKQVEITIHFLNPYAKIYFKKQTGYRNLDFGSIFLFVNGFRVSPYGEPGNDWLMLNRRKQQGTSRHLGTRDLVGKIDVFDSEGGFKSVSSREGLVTNDHFRDLFVTEERDDSLFERTRKRLERFVVNGLDWDSLSLTESERVTHLKMLEDKLMASEIDNLDKHERWKKTSSERNLSIASSLNSIMGLKKDELKDVYVNPDLLMDLYDEEIEEKKAIIEGLNNFDGYVSAEKVRKAISHLKTETEQVSKKLGKVEEKKKKGEEKIRSLAKDLQDVERQVYFHKKLLGQEKKDLLYLHHEIGVLADTISKNLSLMMERIEFQKNEDPEFKKYILRIAKANERIISVSRFATVADLQEQSRVKSRNLVLFISEYVGTLQENRIFSALGGGSMKFGIAGNNITWKLSFKQIDICMIIDNLISNAVKAGATKVDFDFTLEDKSLLVSITNNGRKINGDLVNKIFDIGFTTTKGSGMGLPHIEDILKQMNGNIELAKADPVLFHLRFPSENAN
ncbi:sensory histidine kinase AtoS [compost metagenome]